MTAPYATVGQHFYNSIYSLYILNTFNSVSWWKVKDYESCCAQAYLLSLTKQLSKNRAALTANFREQIELPASHYHPQQFLEVFLLTSSSVSNQSLSEILSLQWCGMQHKQFSRRTHCLHLQKTVAVGSSKSWYTSTRLNTVTSRKTVLLLQYISFKTNTGEKLSKMDQAMKIYRW